MAQNKVFRNLLIVARQEFRMTALNKAFVAMTVLGPFFIAAIAILPGMLAERQTQITEETIVAVTGGSGELQQAMQNQLEETMIQLEQYPDAEAARDAVINDEAAGALLIPQDYLQADRVNYVSRTGTDMHIAGLLENTLGSVVFQQRVSQAGFDAEEISRLARRPDVAIQSIETGEEDGEQDFLAIILTAVTFVLMIYMTVLLYGQMIGRSVLGEKMSNTVEIMLSSVRPTDLLFGKIFGKGIAALIQYGIWIGMALLLVTLVGPYFDISIPPTLSAANFGFLLLFFLLAFFLYSACYAAIGAGAEDEQHLGQLSMPLIMFLIVPMVLVSPIVMNPTGPLVAVLSYVPFTSPIIMMIRVLVDMPPLWEILLSIAVVIFSTLFLGYAAARVFRVGILLGGSRKSWKDILRWAISG
ncbi:MAG: ABC transporter permease [Spirochaeta sp.]